MDTKTLGLEGFKRLINKSVLTDRESQLLMKDSHSYSDSEAQILTNYYESMITGFFQCVADGYAFCNTSLIADGFGFTVEQNYPGASATFLQFARTYWTFKIMQEEFRRSFSGVGLGFLFSKLESQLGAVFFPMPGIRPPKFLRKRLQKNLLIEHKAAFNIKDFMLGNPYLK